MTHDELFIRLRRHDHKVRQNTYFVSSNLEIAIQDGLREHYRKCMGEPYWIPWVQNHHILLFGKEWIVKSELR